MIRHNWFYKLLALAVALVLWVYVNAERNPQARRSFTVPLEIRSLSKGYVAEVRHKGASVIEVKLTVEGLKANVDSVREEDVKAWVDLTGFEPNSPKSLAVRTSVSGVSPEELEISCAPPTVEVGIEAVSRKQLPVEVKFVSAPPVGYSYSDPAITPASVSVSGKSALVAEVKRIVVTIPNQKPNEPIDDYFNVTALNSVGKPVTGVKLSPGKVGLKVQLVEVPATKTVVVSHNVTGQPKYPARIASVSVSPSSVTLKGKPTTLMGVSTVSTEALSVKGAEETVVGDVALVPPPGLEVVDAKKVRVRVEIESPE